MDVRACARRADFYFYFISSRCVHLCFPFPALRSVQPVVVAGVCRIISGEVPAQGSYQAKHAGTMTLTWDNHFSWMTSKALKYMLRKTERRREAEGVAPPPQEAAPAPTPAAQ